MSANKLCKTCHKCLLPEEFIIGKRIYATCNLCREKVNTKRRKNICEVCGIKGIFNFEGEKQGKFCKTHKKIGMIDVIIPKCVVCKKKQPVFNYENESKATHCKGCSEVGMVDILSPKCIICKKKQPVFNYENESKATHCKDCSEEGMVDILSPKCIICKKTKPSFNYENESKATHCKDCSEEDMIDIKHSKCIICKKKRPSFNYENESKATHCKDCSEEDMIDIKHSKCTVCQKKIPSFNYENEIKATHCKDCCEEDMIDIKHPVCVICKKKRPNFNFEGETKATHCKDCSEENMVDIKSKKCIVCNIKRPSFNFEGEVKATHCKNCSEIGMIDIKHSKCIVCKNHASFGYINQPRTYCARHKLPLMFKKKYLCQECDNVAEYGDEEPSHCFIHQKNNELCLLGQKCKQCLRENELCNKEQICLTYCKPTETTIAIKKIIKKKEALVLAYVDNNLKTDLIPIDDRIIDISCVKRRPDRLYDCGTHYVIIEVDEGGDNHSSASIGCIYDKKTQEQRRMIQIFEALSLGPDVCDNKIISQIPVIFIRFNPDNFRVNGKIQKVNMQKRLEVLLKCINYCITYNIEKFNAIINVKYLYYNEYDETNSEFESIKI
jgi:hypothetical protein